jgi:hypothetical protein
MSETQRTLWGVIEELIHLDVDVARIGDATDKVRLGEPLHKPLEQASDEFHDSIDDARRAAIEAYAALRAVAALTRPAKDPETDPDEE